MHFVFLACNKNEKFFRNDPSYIYRCENLSLALVKKGHTVELIHLNSFKLFKKVDAVIFHRPSFSVKLWFILKILRLRETFHIVDIDDFIFNIDYARQSPAYVNNILNLTQVKKKFKKNFTALRLFKYFSISTKPLELQLKNLLPEVSTVIISNAVFDSWKKQNTKILDKSRKIISYLPGTKSHDKDFASISKPLTRFLENHKDIKLKITGPLSFKLDTIKDQIEHREKVSFQRHFKNYEEVWVNIAPLESSEFTKSKSALKVIEAGFFNIPTIISAIPDTDKFVDKGALIFNNEEEFYNHLENLLDEENYRVLTNELQGKIMDLADINEMANRFLQFIEKQKPLEMAKERRRNGIYDISTLKLYQKAWISKKEANTLLEYYMFCRDLGYKLSKVRYKKLKNTYTAISMKYKKKARLLFEEYETIDTKGNHAFLKKYLLGKELYIVGNSSNMRNTYLGKKIDKFDIIVRFNNCCHNSSKKDLGEKTDIWVSAPDIKFIIDSKVVIITGPDMFGRSKNWKKLQNFQTTKVITVPLKIWKELVGKLHAPPSAGILILYWFISILGDKSKICIAGFDLDMKNKIYHYSNDEYKAVTRHNWIAEKKLLLNWFNRGILYDCK